MSERPDNTTPSPMLDAEHGLRLLRSSGSRQTPQRVAMLEVFAHHSAHMTAPQMFEHLTAREPTLSRATVYNNLDLFVQLGLVARHQSDEGVVYYDANTAPHHHVVCPGCGLVSDVDVPERLMEQLLSSVRSEGSTGAVQSASIWFKGVCESCESGE